jgi:hypothetical protein
VSAIGCEKLCGECTRCGPLVWALHALSAGYPLAEAVARRTQWGKAALDPAALAELLARALRGRGASADVLDRNAIDEHPDPDVLFSPDGGEIVYDARGITCGALLTMPRARSALSRLLAAGLCAPEKAVRLLEEP